MEKFTWSIPGPRRVRHGTWNDYMVENYPAYAALGLLTWDAISEYLKGK